MVKVSFIIAVYNTREYVARCLESIINQTLEEIEIICIDDCSTDGSMEEVLFWQKTDDRIKVFKNDSNSGLSYTRNKGISLSTGEYLWFIDSDDMISDNTAAEELYLKAKGYNLDILSFDMDCIFDNSDLEKKYGMIDRKHYELYPDCCTGEDMFVLQMENDDFISPVVVYLFNRTWLLSVGAAFEHVLHEDMLFTIEMMLKANRVGYVFRKGYVYIRREGSITSSNTNIEKKVASIAFIITEIFSRMGKMELKETTIPIIIMYIKVLNDALVRNTMMCFSRDTFIEYYRQIDHLVVDTILKERYPMISRGFTVEFFKAIHQANSIIVYGAGLVSRQIQQLFCEIGVTDYIIAVTDGKNEDGVMDISEIEDKDSLVIIAAAGDKKNVMSQFARKLGFNNIVFVA